MAPTYDKKADVKNTSEHLTLECPKRAFRLRLGRRFLENFNVFFTTKNLQLVYPPLWRGPFNENPYAKLRLGRSKFNTMLGTFVGAAVVAGVGVFVGCSDFANAVSSSAA